MKAKNTCSVKRLVKLCEKNVLPYGVQLDIEELLAENDRMYKYVKTIDEFIISLNKKRCELK